MTTEIITAKFGNKIRVRVNGILIENDCLLMVKHRELGTQGYLWAPPGGGMEFGTSASENLVREFLEETGIKIEVKKFLFVCEFTKPPLHAVELFFLVAREGGNLRKGHDPELKAKDQIIEEVRFLTTETLLQIPPAALHKAFENIKQASDIVNKSGYFII